MLRRHSAAIPTICLIAGICVVFGRTVAAEFVAWDDPDLVWQNPRLTSPSWGKTLEFWREPCQGLYTPLPYTAWSAIAGLEHASAVRPLRPAPFHIFNLILHITAAVFAFLLLRELMPRVWPAWAGAMLFAIHPLQVEPVNWVAGMNNLMFAAFALAALWQYVLYARDGEGSRRHFWIATALYAGALLSKPTAVVIPLLAAVLDYYFARRPAKAIARPLASWLAMAIPIAVIARVVQPSTLVIPTPIPRRLFVAVDAIGFYLTKVIAPINLRIDYERTPQWLMDHPWAAWPGLAILLPAAVCFLSRRAAWLRAPILIFALALLPVLGLTPFDFQLYSTVADRYMYLPMLGVALLAGRALAKARGSLIAWTVAGIVLTLLAARSFDQTGVWMKTESLAAEQLRLDPGSATGQKILAHSLSALRRDQEAEAAYRAAIAALSRQNPPADGAVWYDFANLLMRNHRYDEAVEEYRIAISRFPPPRQAMSYNNMGIAFYRHGNREAAREAFQTALRLQPDFPEARKNLDLLERK